MTVLNTLTFRKFNDNDIVINSNYFRGKTPRVIVNNDGVKLTRSYKIIGVDLLD